MTRRDYEKFAQMIRFEVQDAKREAEGSEIRANMLQSVANTAQLCCDVFKSDNSAFDKARFLKACGLEG